jgi:hypothetical protein
MSSVQLSGPWFDSTGDAAADRMNSDIGEAVATGGAELVRSALSSVLRHPRTPYAAEHVVTDRTTNGAEIYDNNALYGPWLEGIGSRNSPVTRFPGYSTFRRTTQQVEANADQYAEPAVEKFVREMSS